MNRDDAHWSDRAEFADLLDAERAVEPPPGSDRRVLDRVLGSVAVGAPTPLEGLPHGPVALDGLGGAAGSTGGAATAGSASSAAAGATAAGAAGGSMSVSVAAGGGGLLAMVLGGAAVGTVALGAWLVLAPTTSDAPPEPAVAERSASPVSEASASEASAEAPAFAPAPSAPRLEVPEPTPRAPQPPARAGSKRPAPESTRRVREARLPTPAVEDAPEAPATPAVPAVDDALRGELQLLAEARQALKDTPRAALRSLAAHARRYPQGRFDQERELLAIRALLSASRPDAARARADRFRRDFPSSLHRSTVDALVPPTAD